MTLRELCEAYTRLQGRRNKMGPRGLTDLQYETMRYYVLRYTLVLSSTINEMGKALRGRTPGSYDGPASSQV